MPHICIYHTMDGAFKPTYKYCDTTKTQMKLLMKITQFDDNHKVVHIDASALKKKEKKQLNFNIHRLIMFPSLSYIDLSHTNVRGDIMMITCLPYLSHVNLNSTDVHGNASVRILMPRLKYINVENTDVVSDS